MRMTEIEWNLCVREGKKGAVLSQLSMMVCMTSSSTAFLLNNKSYHYEEIPFRQFISYKNNPTSLKLTFSKYKGLF